MNCMGFQRMNMMKNDNLFISRHVRKNILALYGDAGQQWLKNFPSYISLYEKQWHFKALRSFNDAQFNVVLDAVQDNKSVVFKCCVPNKEFKTEVLALSHYNGIGSVRLIESDIDHGAMLLEKIVPGTSLEKCESIEEATQHAISVCKKLHGSIDDEQSFPTIENWFQGLYRTSDQAINKKLLDQAKLLSRDLLESQTNRFLLHGDLHYANLILNNDDYVAIDPKGVIGESEFEIPLPRVNSGVTQEKLLQHLDCFIELSGFDKNRIYQWVFVKAILAACWTVEDSGSVTDFTKKFLSVAEILRHAI